MSILTLYTRDGCHLCEEMTEALTKYTRNHDFKLEIVEITGNPELEARYGHKVPVLTEGEEEICHYFLDEEALKRHLGIKSSKLEVPR